MQLIVLLISSVGALVTVAISTAPDGGFHRESMCSQTIPAHIPHNMLKEVKVQIARWHQGGTPIPLTSACISERFDRSNWGKVLLATCAGKTRLC